MQQLKQETEKWLRKIEPLAEKIETNGSKAEELLKNMKAYIADSKHFLEKGDLVKAFETVIWAWSIFEIAKDLKFFEISE